MKFDYPLGILLLIILKESNKNMNVRFYKIWSDIQRLVIIFLFYVKQFKVQPVLFSASGLFYCLFISFYCNVEPDTDHQLEPPSANLELSPVTNTTPASASLPAPNQNEYETIQDPPLSTGVTRPYSSVSQRDMEPPNIYSHPRPVASPVENTLTSGPYNNTPGQLDEYQNCDVPSGSAVASHHDTESPYVDTT